MKKTQTAMLLVGLLAFACSKPVESNLQSFTNKVLANLDVATIQSLETPYEGIFGSATGGRSSGSVVNLADISTKLSNLFPDAVVLDTEVTIERGLEIWEIKIKMPSGGILKLDFAKKLGEIVKIKGKTGPFDYEIDPGGSFIAFSTAKDLALNTANGEIAQWSLDIEENNDWVYSFQIVGTDKRFEVEVKGFEATVLAIKEKQPGQDVDNDGVEEGDKEGNNGEDQNIVAPDSVANFVKEYFMGTVVQSEKHEEDNGTSWKLYVENDKGATVKFTVLANPLEIVKLEGEKGPFDYNIVLNDNILSLNAALDTVFMSVDGELTQWKLKNEEEDSRSNWRYGFEVTSSAIRYEIEMDAQTGEILKTEEDD